MPKQRIARPTVENYTSHHRIIDFFAPAGQRKGRLSPAGALRGRSANGSSLPPTALRRAPPLKIMIITGGSSNDIEPGLRCTTSIIR